MSTFRRNSLVALTSLGLAGALVVAGRGLADTQSASVSSQPASQVEGATASARPTLEPTPTPTVSPTPAPQQEPSQAATASPTPFDGPQPTLVPTNSPNPTITHVPTPRIDPKVVGVSVVMTTRPTAAPTPIPTPHAELILSEKWGGDISPWSDGIYIIRMSREMVDWAAKVIGSTEAGSWAATFHNVKSCEEDGEPTCQVVYRIFTPSGTITSKPQIYAVFTSPEGQIVTVGTPPPGY